MFFGANRRRTKFGLGLKRGKLCPEDAGRTADPLAGTRVGSNGAMGRGTNPVYQPCYRSLYSL